MKKFFAILLLVCFCFGSMGMAYAQKYVVNTESDPLLVRDANNSSIILGKIKKGATINVTSTDKFWAYITYKNQAGKVYKSYLKPVKGTTNSNNSKKSTTSKKTPVYRESIDTSVASKIYAVKDTVNDCINARAYKSTKARSLGQLYPGDSIYVVNSGYKWTRIVYAGQYAFVLTRCIEEVGPNLPEEGTLYTVTVKEGTTLNVREEDNKESTVLRKIPNGAYVKVIDEGDEWCKVFYEKDAVGYVMKEFITPVE